MKKWVFVILFLLMVLGFFYSPINNNNFSYMGCGGVPNNNEVIGCGVQENQECQYTINLNEASGQIPGSISSVVELPAVYNYEGFRTTSWQFKVQGNDLKVILPQISNNIGPASKVAEQEIEPGYSPVSIDNCKVFLFRYQRPSANLQYQVEKTKEGVDSNGRITCYYNGGQISKDLIELGGKSTTNSEICPDKFNGQKLSTGQECSSVEICNVNVPQGEDSFYLAHMEVDECGNRIIKPGESGRAFTQVEFDSGTMRQLAQNWVDSCRAKYETNKCGDKRFDSNEECEKDNNGGTIFVIKETGQSFASGVDACNKLPAENGVAFTSGDLKCTTQCTIDKSDCGRDINGMVQIDVKTDATDSAGAVLKANIFSKVIAQLNIEGAKNSGDFRNMKYVLRTEGGDSFKGVYASSLETLYSGAPKTSNLIFKRGKAGVLGSGIVYSVENDGLTVKKVYDIDFSVINTLSQIGSGKESDWKYSEITVELQKRSDGNYDSIVSQKIINTKRPLAGNIFIGSTQFIITESEARDVMAELLFRFKSYETKVQGATELNPRPDGTVNNPKIPVIDSKDLEVKIRTQEITLAPGYKLKQLHKYIPWIIDSDIFMNKQITYTTINISDLAKYLSLLQRLLGYSGESGYVDPNFNFDPGEFA